uniref:Cytochrome b5 heme-binding domain-containing protein n=2 Tax=Chrysotila carterae TaxID=13221 RepID=A0A7S4B404_CHRCT
MTIHNKVYNVTKYLDEHPGGEEVLMDRAGQNATMDYEDVGHSKDARKQLDKFEIGELPPSERSKDEAGSADAAAGGGGLMLAIPVLLAAVGAGYYFYFSEQ